MLQAAVVCLAALSAPPLEFDVELDQHFVLRGSTHPETLVVLESRGQTTRVVSQRDGRFAVNVRPGVYVVRAGDGRYLCRAWAPRTAPPSAQGELLLPVTVVRGQQGVGNALWTLDRLTWPVLIGTGVGLSTWAAIDGSGS